MISITIPASEYYDERTGEFGTIKEQTIQLEHSLKSIAKWESKWHKPFLSNDGRTTEEMLHYIKCMTVTQNVKDEVYMFIPAQEYERIIKYIEDPMTATTIRKDPNARRPRRKVITNEELYYDMVALGIPFECERWHLNRLITLIEVCNEKNKPPKKMSRSEIASRNRSLNAANRKRFNTRG